MEVAADADTLAANSLKSAMDTLAFAAACDSSVFVRFKNADRVALSAAPTASAELVTVAMTS